MNGYYPVMTTGAIFIIVVIVAIGIALVVAAFYDRTRGRDVATDPDRLNQPADRGRWRWARRR